MHFTPHSPRQHGFTLVELLVSVMLSGIVLTAAYSAFQGIMQSQVRLGSVISIQDNLFYFNEKLATLIRSGGTVDYEEYFNRRMLGYERGFVKEAEEEVWTYKDISQYGNGGESMFQCGVTATDDSDACLARNAVGMVDVPGAPSRIFNRTLSGQQLYGQYAMLGFDYSSALPMNNKLPSIFPENPSSLSQEGLPELYLIKKLSDGSYERVYFRHVFVQELLVNTQCDPRKNLEGCRGKIQMTKMRSCNISENDTIVDAWIPDIDFSATGMTCESFSQNNYDIVENIIWVDVSSPDLDVFRASFLPKPSKIPGFMAGTEDGATSPTMQMHLEIRFSEALIRRNLLSPQLNTPRALITSFNLTET